MSKIVRYKVDLSNPPPLTAEQQVELQAFAEMPKPSIEDSDIPWLTNMFWKNAASNRFYRPNKTSTTVRIDSDVLAWLKIPSTGYQTRINAILCEVMIRSLGSRS